MRSVSRAAFQLASAAAPVRCRLLATAADPLLFTPGPLTTSCTVKAAMQHDIGSRDPRFLDIVGNVRERLTRLAGASEEAGFTSVLMQGSGTFAVESVLCTVVPRRGARLLVASNGAYGERIVKIAAVHEIPTTVVRAPENEAISEGLVLDAVRRDAGITHVAAVHHETTAGVLNPIEAIGSALHRERPAASFIVDSMSAFGAYPMSMGPSSIHFMVSSANKCIEGVPGFAFAVCDRQRLQAAAGAARSVSLDLLEQWRGLSQTRQFRFTPPTHALLAFHRALLEHEAEGGAAGRLARYQANFEVLKAGMAALGFRLYVADGPAQGCIISTFLFPDDPAFSFPRFYAGLERRGCVIYPGKLTAVDAFRVGSIGQLHEKDMRYLLECVREELLQMGVALPVRQRA